jgi:hypothetical protein
LQCCGSPKAKSPTYLRFAVVASRRRKDTRISYIIFKSISALSSRRCVRAAVTRRGRISHAESWTTAGDYQVRLLYLVCRYLRVSSVHTLSFSLYTARQIYTSRNYPRCSHVHRRRKISHSIARSVKRRMHNSRSLYTPPHHKYTCV